MGSIRVAIVTFNGFNELDSLIALHLLGRVRDHGVAAELVAPSEEITSLNGVRLTNLRPLEWSHDADVVLVGSGRGTLDAVGDEAVMARLRLQPTRQLIGSQCSGALVLHRLGLLGRLPLSTDASTRRHFEDLGIAVSGRAFAADGDVATAGGCLAAQYLAAWVITRVLNWECARAALSYAAPVGEEQALLKRVEATLSEGGLELP